MPAHADEGLSTNDARLIDEAIRRLRSSTGAVAVPNEALFNMLANEFRRGRRDLFNLVKAGQRSLDEGLD